MLAYLILDLKITDYEVFKEYIVKIPVFIKQYGGKYLVQSVEPEIIEGDWSPERVVLLEFPSKEKAKDFLGDPDAKKLFDIRHHKSTVSQLILADGCC